MLSYQKHSHIIKLYVKVRDNERVYCFENLPIRSEYIPFTALSDLAKEPKLCHNERENINILKTDKDFISCTEEYSPYCYFTLIK